MFHQVLGVAKEIHLEMLSIYWILLPVLVIVLMLFEILSQNASRGTVYDTFRALIVSVVLIMSIDFVINNLGMLADEIIRKISKDKTIWETLKSLSPPESFDGQKDSWFSLKGHILYALGIISYLIAYLGFFAAEALTHFVWICLYILSPLMILAYIPKSTRVITKNLYVGLVKVVLWKILWTILAVLLLKLSSSPPAIGLEDYLMSIVLNLCIGISMLLIPVSCSALLNGAFESTGSMVAAAPSYAAISAIKSGSKNIAKKGLESGKRTASFVAKPVTNPINAGIQKTKSVVEPAKNYYANINLPKQKEDKNV